MTVANIKVMICTILGTLGGVVANLFGGWSEDMITLLVLMSADFCMGLVVAGVFNRSTKTASGALESKAGWKGLCRKGVTLLMVLVAHRLDVSLGISYIRTATVIGFMVNEMLSIVENAGLMGIPLPDALNRAIEVLKDHQPKGR